MCGRVRGGEFREKRNFVVPTVSDGELDSSLATLRVSNAPRVSVILQRRNVVLDIHVSISWSNGHNDSTVTLTMVGESDSLIALESEQQII